jgi:hypothetical protein
VLSGGGVTFSLVLDSLEHAVSNAAKTKRAGRPFFTDDARSQARPSLTISVNQLQE